MFQTVADDPNYVRQHAHFTFDFAQAVGLPQHVHQESPLFFKKLRKVDIFGVHDEATGLQVNYLIDEGSAPAENGKGSHGASAVCSYLHHFLDNLAGRNIKTLVLNADNCSGKIITYSTQCTAYSVLFILHFYV